MPSLRVGTAGYEQPVTEDRFFHGEIVWKTRDPISKLLVGLTVLRDRAPSCFIMALTSPESRNVYL